MSSDIFITIDIDWAPDFAIEGMAETLIRFGTPATWFVTHETPAITKLREYPDLFELGIHPNLAPDSTQGSTEAEIVEGLKSLIPEAVSVRTHGLIHSTNITIRLAKEYGFRLDSSYFLPRMANVGHHPIRWLKSNLLRVPYIWEDGYEASQADPIWSLDNGFFETPGLKVLNFHPVHWLLNTVDYDVYGHAKEVGPVFTWVDADIEPFVYQGHGPRNFFEEVAEAQGGRARRLKDLLE